MAETGSVKVRIDDAQLKARVRDLLADAWDEGYNQAGWDFIGSEEIDPTEIPSRRNERNPHRAD